MSDATVKRGRIPASWRWLVWLIFAGAWTTSLLMPVPQVGNWSVGESQIDLRYLFAKCVHVSAYAVFTGLSGWLRAPARYRALLLFFVMVHATVTELLQNFTSHRTGCLEDVGFDHLGVALGLLLTWKWWAEAEAEGGRRKAEGGRWKKDSRA